MFSLDETEIGRVGGIVPTGEVPVVPLGEGIPIWSSLSLQETMFHVMQTRKSILLLTAHPLSILKLGQSLRQGARCHQLLITHAESSHHQHQGIVYGGSRQP